MTNVSAPGMREILSKVMASFGRTFGPMHRGELRVRAAIGSSGRPRNAAILLSAKIGGRRCIDGLLRFLVP